MKYEEQLIFIGALSGLIYFAGSNEYDNTQNRYRGILACMIFMCVVGSMRQTTPFKKFSYFWRFMLWLTVTYNAFLMYLCFQNEKEARQLMTLGDSKLGKPITKDFHTYDDNCELEVKNLIDNLDHYFFLHCINWFIVSWLIRDAWILNIWQIWDEIIELSWQHVLPHLRECWWDHVFLDVLIGNAVFIFLGLWIQKKLRIEQYDWLGRKGKKSIGQWEVWTNYHHFGISVGIIGIVTINFLGGFFVMNSLWVPPVNWMVIYRLIIWFFLGSLAFREAWNTFKEEKTESGQARFLVVWTCVVETFISIKFLENSGNIDYQPTPFYIWVPWTVLILGCGAHYLYLRMYHSEKKTWIYEKEQKKISAQLKD